MSNDRNKLERVLNYQFKDPALLERAFIHSSAVKDRTQSFERLEFLGDRVLGLCISEMLYKRFPLEQEGDLGYRFTALVRAEALSLIAGKLDLGSYLVMSNGEIDSGGRQNPAIQANVCEALIGALYLDGGFKTARQFIMLHWSDLLEKDLTPQKDPKTILQELAQKQGKALPSYEIVGRSGPDHAPQFNVAVNVEGTPAVTGTGASKRAAEQDAAEIMLNEINVIQGDEGKR